MILVLSLLTLLVFTSTGAQRIKGGPRIISAPAVVQDPHIHVGKLGGGGALHHTEVVQDPISGDQVVVDKVTRVGGIKGGSPFLLNNPFEPRGLYRNGLSPIPFGLMGSDYYSYPNSLLTAPRAIHRKTVVSDNLSGLRPIGFGGRPSGIIVADPSIGQFSVDDAQLKTSVFGSRSPIYRTGLSPVPFGLLGMDYYSYPKQLMTQRLLDDDFGLGQTRILSGGSPFTIGDSQIHGSLDDVAQEKVTIVESDPLDGSQRITTVKQAASPLGTVAVGAVQEVIPEQIAVVDDGFGQRQVVKTAGGLRGGQILLKGNRRIVGIRKVRVRPDVSTIEASGLAAPFGGFGQRQVTVTKTEPVAIAPVPVIQQEEAFGVVATPAPIPIAPVPAPVPVFQAPISRKTIAQGPGDIFLSQIARPQIEPIVRPAPISFPVSPRVPIASSLLGNIHFTLNGNQLIGGPILDQGNLIAPAPRPVIVPAPQPVIPPAPLFAPAPRPVFPPAPFVPAAPHPIYAPVPRQVFSQAPIITQGQVIDAAPRQIFAAPRPIIAQAPVVAQAPVFDAPRQIFAPAPRPVIAPAPVFDAPRQIFAAAPRPVIAPAPVFDAPRKIFAAPHPIIAQAPAVAHAPVIAAAPQPFLGPFFAGPSKIGGRVTSGLLGLTAVGHTSPTKVITQEEVVGPAGDPQVITTVTDNNSNRLFGSKIGGPVIGGPLGLAPVGAPAKTVTQEEVVGPLGDRQVVTTVTDNAPNRLLGSKIGGPVIGGPLGFAPVGAPAKTVTQEEVVGPLGDRQVVTTVTDNNSNRLLGSKIGGPVISGPVGFAPVGVPAKTVTQEEVVGPLGDRQVVTTVTDNASNRLFGSKIGGPVIGGPLGFAPVGAPAKTVTQEEVVGPLGDRQVVTTVTDNASNRLLGSKIGGPVIGGPLGFAPVGAPAKTVTQEEVVGPLGDRQVVTTVTDHDSNRLLGSKIGGPVIGGPLGFAPVGAPAKTVTQEEVVGPLGDRQVVTTVTDNDSNRLLGSKIGGPVIGGPLGFAPVGASTKTVTQEEVVGPLGDSQTVTTVTKSEPSGIITGPSKIGGFATGGFAGIVRPAAIVQQEEVISPIDGLRTTSKISHVVQDPIETAIQDTLANTAQVHVDDFIGTGGVTQVKETLVQEPFTGDLTKVTEVTKGGISGSDLVQQNIADAIVQENIATDFGRNSLGFAPRISFLSQHPYDAPDVGLLRSVISRPVVQQHEELEQILV